MHGPLAHGPLASALCRCVLLLALPSGGDAVPVRCGTSLVRSDPGVGMSFFCQAYLQSAVWTYSRCPGLVHRSCAAVCCFVRGGLCCLFVCVTLLHRGPDVRSLFCFPANVRNAVLLVAQCPDLGFGLVPLCVVARGKGGDFGDFGVSFAATVAWRYTRRGDPRLSVQGEPLIVLTREP